MSLINQVLKDLEKRHAGADEVRGEARAVRPLPKHAPPRSLWIALGLVAATAVAGGAWWLLAYPDSTATLSTPSARIASNLVTIAPAAIAVPSPASAQEIVGRPQLMPKPVPAGPVAALASGPAPLAPQAPAPEDGTAKSRALQSAKLAPKPADKPARKDSPKANGSHSPSEVGLSGTQPGKYFEPGGVERESNIAKQVRPPSEHERAEAEFRRGMAALQAGETAEGEDRLRAALAIDPLADNARQALLGVYVEHGRREDAEQLLEDRLRLDRTHAGFAMALARLQLEHDANGDALVTLQRSLAYGDASSDYQVMLANALGRVGRHKEAAARFEMAARLAPRNPLWLMGLGVELRADGRPEQARAAFQRARGLGGLTPQLVAFVDHQLRELK